MRVAPKAAWRNEGRRVSSFFKCLSCGLEYNADLNGAVNIGKRFADHWLADGALGFVPLREEPSYLPR